MSDDWLRDDPFADPEDPAAREREQRRREREEKRQKKAAKQAGAEEKAPPPPPPAPPPEEAPLPPRTPEQEFWDEEPEVPDVPPRPDEPVRREEPNLTVPLPPHPNVASGNGSGRRPRRRPPVLGAIARHPFLIFAVIAALFFLWFLGALFQPFHGNGDGSGQVQVTVPNG